MSYNIEVSSEIVYNDVRSALKASRTSCNEIAAEISQEEIDRAKEGIRPWISYDSPLVYTPDQLINPTLANPFQETFKSLLPEGITLKEHIENHMHNRGGYARGIEFGGPGSQLFQGFTAGFFSQTLGVTLADIRSRAGKEEDTQRNHSVIAGNVLHKNTRNEVKKWVGDERVDVIFERVLAGDETIPNDPYLLTSILREWYEMLNIGGIIFAQIPGLLKPLVASWHDKISSKSHEVEVKLDKKPGIMRTLYLRKISDNKLCTLSRKEMIDLYVSTGSFRRYGS